jgi:hypothetical protein
VVRATLGFLWGPMCPQARWADARVLSERRQDQHRPHWINRARGLMSAAAYGQLRTLDRHGHPSDCQALQRAASLIDMDRQENSSEVHKR